MFEMKEEKNDLKPPLPYSGLCSVLGGARKPINFGSSLETSATTNPCVRLRNATSLRDLHIENSNGSLKKATFP